MDILEILKDAFVYDLETYPNAFTATFKHAGTGNVIVFEISDRVNHSTELKQFLDIVIDRGLYLIGFNNLGFDEKVLTEMYKTIVDCGYAAALNAYFTCQSIINGGQWAGSVKPWERIFKQIDLYKINHFDNPAKRTSLKMLEYVMRMDNIQDLPFLPGTELTPDEISVLIEYNIHDVNATDMFFRKCLKAIKLRFELNEQYGVDWTNHSDTKIGSAYFIMKLEEKQPGICFENRKPRQTIRHCIRLNDVIFPYIQFNHPEFNRILYWLRNQTITETKGVFDDLYCTIDGFQFDFGTGGIHGSIDSQIVHATEERTIVDLDVASYYPNLAIMNGLYPEHLSETFVTAYSEIYELRKQRPKKKYPEENLMLKLALNGTYGNSNNKYSPFYDSAFTMAITLNGQLLLCMLSEWLMDNIGDLELIQINTDGVTVLINHSDRWKLDAIAKAWEDFTHLELEAAEYSRMFIRDVNNYIAEYTDGSVKRKGAYEYDLAFHQNHSALVIRKVAEKHLLTGANIEESIIFHDNPLDFMLRTKVSRTSKLLWGDEEIQRISRYYISNNGRELTKIMPPTPKKPDVERRISINAGYNTTICNNLKEHEIADINYKYYIDEVYKLCNPLFSQTHTKNLTSPTHKKIK